MQFQLSIAAAILASVLWAGLCVLTFEPEIFGLEQFLNRELFTNIVIFAAPLLIIWSLAFTAQVKNSGDDGLWNLQNQIQNLRGLLSSYNKQLGQLSRPEGAEPGSGDPAPAEKPAAEKEPEKAQTEEPEEPPKQIRPLQVSRDVLVRAVNFAEDENDTEAFDALDEAAKDPEIDELLGLAIQLLQAMAESDLEIDLLPTDFRQPVEWRKVFPVKDRRQLALLGSVGSASHHSTVKNMLAADPELLKAAESFMDRALSLADRFMAEASDRQILAFANTRTMRACILIHCALTES